jgi:hypothetical protein
MFGSLLRKIISNHFNILYHELSILSFSLYPLDAIIEGVIFYESGVGIPGDFAPILTETQLKILGAMGAVVYQCPGPNAMDILRQQYKRKCQY